MVVVVVVVVVDCSLSGTGRRTFGGGRCPGEYTEPADETEGVRVSHCGFGRGLCGQRIRCYQNSGTISELRSDVPWGLTLGPGWLAPRPVVSAVSCSGWSSAGPEAPAAPEGRGLLRRRLAGACAQWAVSGAATPGPAWPSWWWSAS